MSFSLALSGGGTRGGAHLGALIALEEEKMLPSAIAGCSSGAIVAGLYACPLSLKSMKNIFDEIALNYRKIIDPAYMGIILSLIRVLLLKPPYVSGVIKGNKLERFLEKATGGRTMADCKIPIVIPSVDLLSGKTIVFVKSKDDLPELENVVWKDDVKLSCAMSASSAVPAVFSPRIVDDLYMVDGGVAELLPADLLFNTGNKNILSIDISKNYRMPENRNIVEIATHSFFIMSDRLSQCNSKSQTLLIKPNIPENIGFLDFDRMNECFVAGYESIKANIDIIKYLFK